MSSTSTAAPVDNLVRALFGPESAELRAAADGGDGGTLFGHFAVFNQWTEIDSMWEGNFLERLAPGAFAATLADPARQVKVLYDHGHDPQLGNKPLGAIRDIGEDRTGAFYEVDLLRDTSGTLVPYNRDFIVPAARAGLLGASFRFAVTHEDWDMSGDVTDDNPKGLDLRTITGVELFEFGPVTFPAYDAASASVRCGTDRWIDHFLNDPAFVARLRERVGPGVVDQIRTALPPTVDGGPCVAQTATDPPQRGAPTEPPSADPATTDGGEELQRRLDAHAKRTAAYERFILSRQESS